MEAEAPATPEAESQEVTNFEEAKWCSWCLQPAPMQLIESRFVGRNLYQCRNCDRRVIGCTKCQGMARVHEDREDRLCLRCDDPKPDEVVREAWCSWCCNKTMQRLHKGATFPYGRNLYKCGECGRGCVPCRTCDDASARGHDKGSNDDGCLICCQLFSDWDKAKGKENRLMTYGWCSWCYEKVEHVLEHVSKSGRHAYACSNCHGRTLPCGSCREGMTRGNRTWDDRTCAHCIGEFDSWEHNWQQRRLPRAGYMYN